MTTQASPLPLSNRVSSWVRALTNGIVSSPGHARRGELALAISLVGNLEPPVYIAAIGGSPGAGITLPPQTESGHIVTHIGGERITLASPPTPHPDLHGADRDLALRIANSRPQELPWWRLKLTAELLVRGQNLVVPKPSGSLSPLLVSRMGEVVAAVWTSPDNSLRHYVLPYLPSYMPVLQWLAEWAIPEFVPSVARRIRSSLANEPALQTEAEVATRTALSELGSEFERCRTVLRAKLADVRASADAVRDPLLYGSGSELVTAVECLLRDAELQVISLDELFGDTVSADLLVTWGARRLLVEVKSASGNPSESLAEPPVRHLRTWPNLKPDLPVSGVVLVLSHQIRSHPLDRSPEPYSRREFVDSLTFPIVTTRRLFESWRLGDYEAIRGALFKS